MKCREVEGRDHRLPKSILILLLPPMRKIAIIFRKLEDLHTPKTTIHQILKDELQMRVCLSWVPHFLTGEQLQQRTDCCTENLEIIAEDPDFFKRVITVHESWFHYHDLLSKCESEHRNRKNEQKLCKVRQQKSAGKVQLIAFFVYRGMVYQYVCLPRTRINKHYKVL